MVHYEDICDYPFEALERSNHEVPLRPIVLDTETAGHTKESHFVIYFSWADEDPNIGHGAGPVTTQNGFNFFKAICDSPRPKIFHAITRDLEFIRSTGMEVSGRGYCTLLASALLDEYNPTHALDDLVRDHFGRRREDYNRLEEAKRGASAHTKNLNVDQSIIHPYADQDGQDTLSLWLKFFKQLRDQGLWDLYEIGMDAEVYGWYQMEKDGIEFDVNAAEEALERINPVKDIIETEIHEAFGEEFSINSGKQLGEILAKHFPLTKKTKKGLWVTDKEELRKYRYDWRVQMIIGWRKLAQCASKIRKRVEEGSNRLHGEYKQTLVTGRSSCSGVPLQQIAKRAGRVTVDDVGSAALVNACSSAYQATRKMWTVPCGGTLVTFDLDQGEYRAAAHYTGSARLIGLMQDPTADFHMIITKLIFGDLPDKKLMKVLRDIVKHVSFGILYGMAAPGIEDTIRRLSGKELSEFTSESPQSIMRKYEIEVPEMRKFQKDVLYVYKQLGYVKDVFGRRYRTLPNWFKRAHETDDYAIINYLCQGTVGNVKRYAIARLGKFFHENPMRSKMILDIHDELGFEIYPEDADIIYVIHKAMTDFPMFDVPFTTGPSVGPNLLEVKDMTLEEAVLCIRSGERSRKEFVYES